MCGIAGIVGEAADREAVVRDMTHALRHRGPDGEGFWHDAHCSLGHRRLSVIDLSPAGAQPMPNEDGTVQVVFNGEIYNHAELRRRLESLGHVFRSRTDTEVLVHLYEEHGEDLVHHIRGMFAFAIWDTRRRQLVAVRDRFGQKPLFYSLAGGTLSFASEIKGLLANPAIPDDVDPRAVDQLLTVHFVAAPTTFHTAIHRLPAATLMTYRPGEAPRFREYWSLAGIPQRAIGLEEASEEVDHHLDRAVREQLVADVPVGLFLSGGIDSTLILTKAAKHAPGIASFSIGYEERQFSELRHAQAVAEQFKTLHQSIVLRPDDARHPEALIDMFDEPFADVAAIPQAHLSRTARPMVTVALTGDGGDELFGGYEHHILGYWLDKLSPISGLSAAAARAALRVIPRTGRRGLGRTLRRGLESASHPDWQDAIIRLRATLTDDSRRRLYAPELLERLGPARYDLLLPEVSDADERSIDRLFRVSGDHVLADQFLLKSDIASMSVGLECRSPFLDVQLAELVASFPPSLKVRGLQGKRVLRHLLEGKVDRAIWGRKKMGLTMPVEQWLKSDLAPLVHDVLLSADARTRAYVRPEEIARLYREHVRGVANHYRLLWALLLLELWLRRSSGRRP